MQKYKCQSCGKETSLCLTIREGKEEFGSYCPEFECAKKAIFTIGSLKDRVAMNAMKKAT